MEVKWIKLATDIFDNRKIKQIESFPQGDTIIVIWMKLLCLSGITNDNGYVYFTKDIPFTEQMLSAQFNRPLATIQLALKIFEQFGMIEVVDNILLVSNWEKYQNVDGLEKIREQTRLRVAKHRESKRICNVTGNANVTQCNALDIDKEIDIDKEKNINTISDDFSELRELEAFSKHLESKPSKTTKFLPPTLEQVKSYAEARGRLDIAEKFYDYYNVGNWKDAKGNSVKNWKQKFVTWESRNEPVKKTERTIDEMQGQSNISDVRKALFE